MAGKPPVRRGPDNNMWKGGPIKKKCVVCGKTYQVYPYREKITKTCSNECRWKYMSKKQMGPKNPAWKGGKIPLTTRRRRLVRYKDWRKQVFERDDYTCQVCGKKGGHLNAHHIKKFSRYKEDRLSINNGVTTCIKCHYKINGHEDDWEIFFYENLIRRGIVKKPFGWQILVDAYHCKHETMDDVNLVYNFLEAAVAVLGVQKQHPPFVFHSPSGYPDKAGISSFVAIIESGISVHTLSCKDYASIDYYSCSAMSHETETRLIGIVNEYFHPTKIERQFVLRGTEYNEED